jgi:ubiquitin carboxyl-terminal hydrolase 48
LIFIHCFIRNQDAVRSLSLVKLPDVLNVQLLRFVYDPNTGRKRKLQDSIVLPETIRLGDHLASSSSDAIAGTDTYDLVAILRHQGTSAYHGHYVAEA